MGASCDSTRGPSADSGGPGRPRRASAARGAVRVWSRQVRSPCGSRRAGQIGIPTYIFIRRRCRAGRRPRLASREKGLFENEIITAFFSSFPPPACPRVPRFPFRGEMLIAVRRQAALHSAAWPAAEVPLNAAAGRSWRAQPETTAPTPPFPRGQCREQYSVPGLTPTTVRAHFPMNQLSWPSQPSPQPRSRARWRGGRLSVQQGSRRGAEPPPPQGHPVLGRPLPTARRVRATRPNLHWAPM